MCGHHRIIIRSSWSHHTIIRGEDHHLFSSIWEISESFDIFRFISLPPNFSSSHSHFITSLQAAGLPGVQLDREKFVNKDHLDHHHDGKWSWLLSWWWWRVMLMMIIIMIVYLITHATFEILKQLNVQDDKNYLFLWMCLLWWDMLFQTIFRCYGASCSIFSCSIHNLRYKWSHSLEISIKI